MNTGTAREDDVRSAHNMAVCIGGIRAFCCRLVPHMVAMQQAERSLDTSELFSACAKYELLRKGGGVGDLQTIVERVIESDDGFPCFSDDVQPLVNEIMQDYECAKMSALSGKEALDHYRAHSLVPSIMRCAEGDGGFELCLDEVKKCVEDWESFTPTRPFECIVSNFITQMRLK